MPVMDQFFQLFFADLLAVLIITGCNFCGLVIIFHANEESQLFLFSRGKLHYSSQCAAAILIVVSLTV